MTDTENGEVFTLPEVAQKLKKHPQTIRRWIRKGLLPAVRVGKFGHYMIYAKDLESINSKSANENDGEQI